MKRQQYSSKSIKVLGVVVLGSVCLVAGFVAGKASRAETFVNVVDDIVKTVAHVSIDTEDLELIYEDLDNDVAYYRYIGERDRVAQGTTLYLHDSSPLTVSSVGAHGFTVSSDTVTFKVGMSGDPILDAEGNQIGYISALLSNGHVYCIWT